MIEILTVYIMLCENGLPSTRQVQAKANCVAYALDACPSDLNKQGMIDCAKSIADKSKAGDFGR